MEQTLKNLRVWKTRLESIVGGMSSGWPEYRKYQSQIETLDSAINFIEATKEENDELGRMLKEKGMRENEFLPGFLERLTANQP